MVLHRPAGHFFVRIIVAKGKWVLAVWAFERDAIDLGKSEVSQEGLCWTVVRVAYLPTVFAMFDMLIRCLILRHYSRHGRRAAVICIGVDVYLAHTVIDGRSIPPTGKFSSHPKLWWQADSGLSAIEKCPVVLEEHWRSQWHPTEEYCWTSPPRRTPSDQQWHPAPGGW
jgi:hypothetical protein